MKDAIAIEQLMNRLEENLRAHLTFQTSPNRPEFHAIAVIRALREHIAELEKSYKMMTDLNAELSDTVQRLVGELDNRRTSNVGTSQFT